MVYGHEIEYLFDIHCRNREWLIYIRIGSAVVMVLPRDVLPWSDEKSREEWCMYKARVSSDYITKMFSDNNYRVSDSVSAQCR